MYYYASTMKQTAIASIATIITRLSTQAEIEDFLAGILTPKEIEELALRIQIVKQLKAGISQREIATKLGVGIATVTRGSKEIQSGKFSQNWWASTDPSWRDA